MATLVLGAVGSAIGGAFGGAILGFSGAAIGGFIGSTVGSVVDSWIVSSLAPAQKIEGQRLDSLRITSAIEGAVIPRLYGRLRIGGNIIWATDFREETKTTTQGGGKGGGGGKVRTTEYLYYASFAVALCEGPITGIGRIGEGKPRLVGDLMVRISPVAQDGDVLQQLQRTLLAAGDVLDHAAQKAFGLARIHDDGRDVGFPKGDISLHPALTADQTIGRSRRFIDPGDRDRLFQPDLADTVHERAKGLFRAFARIFHGDGGNRDHLHFVPHLDFAHHGATSETGTRLAMSKKKSSVSNRKASSIRPFSSASPKGLIRISNWGSR